ncbi:MAG: glycosyl hydrolase [Rhodopirellula sp. JB053]
MRSLTRRTFLTGSASVALSPTLLAGPATYRQGKKGLGITSKSPNWNERVKALELDWFYTWGARQPKDTPEGVQFIPMLWGWYGDQSIKALDKIKSASEDVADKTLLGFNEPDGKSQSNISVDKAIQVWPELMKTGLPLASPACVHADGKWMQEFMSKAQAKKLRIDFVCIHSYSGPNAGNFLSKVQKIYRMYGRPLWITEFAIGDWSAKSVKENKHRPQKIGNFMRAVVPQLNRTPYVHRYAWFPASTTNRALGTSALFKPDGSLTGLGNLYREIS